MSERFEILWSSTAERDLERILDYLVAEAGVDAALRLYESVRRAVDTLIQHPRRCRVGPELREVGLTEFREMLLTPHRIVFRLADGQVYLVAIVDDRRDLAELLVERALDVP